MAPYIRKVIPMDKKDLFNTTNTIKVRKQQEHVGSTHDVLAHVCNAMIEKGYDPVDHLVGYFLSEDPTYITSNKNARTMIGKLERYDLIEELVSFYIEHSIKGKKIK